jgi:hypothetical protein
VAKASDLMGRSGAAGFGTPAPTPGVIKEPAQVAKDKTNKFKPPKDQRPGGGGGSGGVGGAPTSVRPKV